MDKGYIQAIENLAYFIIQLSEDTQSYVYDEYPWIMNESADFQMEFTHNLMTDEEKDKWAQLDYIYDVICITYNISPKKMFNDVEVRIQQLDSVYLLN